MTTRAGQLTSAKRAEPRPRGKRRPAPRPDPALLSAIFDSFSAGMLVVDRTGTVIAYNRAVAETLTKPTAGRDTCCLLFGCRRQLREHEQHEVPDPTRYRLRPTFRDASKAPGQALTASYG